MLAARAKGGRVERELTFLRALARWVRTWLELALPAGPGGAGLDLMMRGDPSAMGSPCTIIPKW